MENKSNGSFYYVIPAEIMHSKELDIYEKHLYALISGLSNKYGYCFASNEWFEKELGVKEKKIQRHLLKLEKGGYIHRQIFSHENNPFKKERRIYLNTVFKKSLPGVSPDALGGVSPDGSVPSPQTGIISEDKKLISKDIKKSAPPPPSAYASDLCKFFIEKIKERNPKFKDPRLREWEKEFQHLLEIDKRDLQETKELIEWIHTNSFWKANCLSPEALRKHYDKMWMQRQAEGEQSVVEANRGFAINLKKKYPDRLKNLTISPKYAMKLDSGKELPFTLPIDTFKNALCNMFGGRYEPNRSNDTTSEVESSSEE